MVDRIDLEDLSRRSPIRARGPDRFQYDITITKAGERHYISVGEGELSDDLRALVDRVLQGGM
jgi:hypothetical protein